MYVLICSVEFINIMLLLILISHTKNVNDILKLNLLETYTLAILKYACESLLLNDNTLYILNVCLNNVFRKVFKMNRWESVTRKAIIEAVIRRNAICLING